MIYVLHTGHSPVFARLADRMAAALPDARAMTHVEALENGFVGVSHVVAVWWRAAEMVLERLPDDVKLIVCLYDHRSWRTGGFTVPVHRAMAVMACNRMLHDELIGLGVKSTCYQPDGVDCTMFAPGERVPGLSPYLRIGWCGSSKIDSKRINLVKRVQAESRHAAVIVHDSDALPMPHEAMPDWYRSLDAILCLSEHEGTPNPILEACACGLPYISTPVGLVPQLAAAPGTGGIMLPANPSAAVVLEAIAELVAGRETMHLWGERNRALMLAEYQWDFTALCSCLGVKSASPKFELVPQPLPRLLPEEFPVQSCPGVMPFPRHPRILVVNRTIGLGGGERSAVLFLNALAGLYEIDLALTMTEDATRPPELDARVRIVLAPGPDDLLALAAERKYAGVLVNNCQAPCLELLRLGIPYVGYIMRGFVRWSLLQLPAAPAPPEMHVWAISTEIKRGLLRQRNDLREEQIDVVPNGVDTRRFRPSPDRAELPWKKGCGPIFGFVGRFAAVKNIPTLVRLFAQARKSLPGAKFLIVSGCDSTASAEYQQGWLDYEAEVRRTVAELGLESCVHITGMVQDPERYYRCLDVCLLASTYEGMPLMILESLASGVPVVTTKVGNVTTLLRDGGGSVVEGSVINSPEVRDRYVEAMLAVAADSKSLGDLGRANVVKAFSADTHGDVARAYFARHVPRRRIKVMALYDSLGSPFWMVSEQVRLAMPDADVCTMPFAAVADLASNDADVVFNPSYFPAADLLAALPQKTGLVSTVPNHYRWQSGPGKVHLAAALERSARVLCTNERLLAEVAEHFPGRADKLSLGLSGVDTDLFAPNGKRDEPNGTLIVGWAGSLAHHGELKGLEIIREACARVAGVKLRVANADVRQRTPMEMAEWYRSLDLYICMSSSEGTCNPLLEAAASGVGSILTAVGVAPSLAAAGCVRIVERSRDALEEALAEARQDPTAVIALGHRARIVAVEDWQWKRRIRAYVDAIEAVCHD